MNCASGPDKQQKLLADILRFVGGTSGLRSELTNVSLSILQSIDGKSISFQLTNLADVLVRSDVAGEEFLQVNFASGAKILLTDTLIGFKPSAPKGLDTSRVPRVVTTPDAVNVFEAIQDALHTSGPNSHEMAILKKIFDAVLTGGEAVGFNLSIERSWLARLPSSATKLSS